MLILALYMGVSRMRRVSGDRRFDRSMRGDLDHAIATAGYQVRFSRFMRWNILPVGLLCILGVLENGNPLWAVGALLIVFALATYAGGGEHNIYRSRKRELESLRDKLDIEIPEEIAS